MNKETKPIEVEKIETEVAQPDRFKYFNEYEMDNGKGVKVTMYTPMQVTLEQVEQEIASLEKQLAEKQALKAEIEKA